MKISVVVPAYNEEKLIEQTLRSIGSSFSSFARRGWETELVVCNNNSTDRTAEIAQANGAVVVFEPINQIARARNTGAQAASGDWLIFIDADSEPSPALFEDVAQAIQTGRYVAGGCTLKIDCPLSLAQAGVACWNGISRLTKYLAGSFIFCETNIFRQLGGFNQKLFASEEIELSRRLKPLARHLGKRLVILHQHPLLTSARKLHLYSLREHFGFLGRTILTFGRPLKDPKACFTWYDGRR